MSSWTFPLQFFKSPCKLGPRIESEFRSVKVTFFFLLASLELQNISLQRCCFQHLEIFYFIKIPSSYIFNFFFVVAAAYFVLKIKWKWKSLSCAWLFATPWTIQSMEFSKPEYWSGQPLPSPGDLPNPDLLHCSHILYQLSHREACVR